MRCWAKRSDHPDLKPLFADAAAEEKAWFAKHRVRPINHMVVVSQSLSRQASRRRARGASAARRIRQRLTRIAALFGRRNAPLARTDHAIYRPAGADPAPPSPSTNCSTTSRARSSDGGSHASRADLRSRPSRPYGIADAEARGEPEVLRRRHGHDGQRAKGRVRLFARLGRLRALFAEADGIEDLRHGAHGACARAARRRWSAASRR